MGGGGGGGGGWWVQSNFSVQLWSKLFLDLGLGTWTKLNKKDLPQAAWQDFGLLLLRLDSGIYGFPT